ncbi:MAG: hypothetical protein M0D57_15835 [Sphingobacteriales bacterium JAD_PAG50586_3]|nr:MAG: hypothetical protein M0D57_15835 [Sphingobacteriales bacterium JAD_PAG50586_3]
MKKNLFLFATLIISVSVFAQPPAAKEKPLSNAEQFSLKSGTLIEKQYIEIGKVKGIEVKVLKLKDLNDNTAKTALRFEYEYKSSYSTDTKIAVLDSDEIDGLIKSIKNLQANVFPTVKDVYTEVIYKSRTGFEAGAFYDKDRAKWVTYVQLEKYGSGSSVFLTVEDFTTLLDLVEQAKLKM